MSSSGPTGSLWWAQFNARSWQPRPSAWMTSSTGWFHQQSTENNKHFLSLHWQMEASVQLFSLCITMKSKGWNVLTVILHVTTFISGMVLIQLSFNNWNKIKSKSSYKLIIINVHTFHFCKRPSEPPGWSIAKCTHTLWLLRVSTQFNVKCLGM